MSNQKTAFPQVQVGTNKYGMIKSSSPNNQPKNRLGQEGLEKTCANGSENTNFNCF